MTPNSQNAVITVVGRDRVGILELGERLEQLGETIGISIRVQHADIFDTMHRI